MDIVAFVLVAACLTTHAAGNAETQKATAPSIPYFVFDVRTSSYTSKDVFSQGIANCLGLDVPVVAYSAYTVTAVDDSTAISLQFQDDRFTTSMAQYISTANSTANARECLHDQCNNLVIFSITETYATPAPPEGSGDENFLSRYPYVYVGVGAGGLMVFITIVVIAIKIKENREKGEFVEPLSSAEEGNGPRRPQPPGRILHKSKSGAPKPTLQRQPRPQEAGARQVADTDGVPCSSPPSQSASATPTQPQHAVPQDNLYRDEGSAADLPLQLQDPLGCEPKAVGTVAPLAKEAADGEQQSAAHRGSESFQ